MCFRSNFEVSKRTVFASSLFDDTRIIQICPDVIRLLRGTELKQNIPLDAFLREFEPEAEKPLLTKETTSFTQEPSKTDTIDPQKLSNVFYDFGQTQEDSMVADFMMEDGLPTGSEAFGMDLDLYSGPAVIRSASVCDPFILLLLSDGHVLILEGDSNTKTVKLFTDAYEDFYALNDKDSSMQITAACLFEDTNLWLSEGRPNEGYKMPIFCLVCRTNGQLDIYALPQMHRLVSYPGFAFGLRILSMHFAEPFEAITIPRVVEIRMECFSKEISDRDSLISKPLLFAILDDNTVMAYVGFRSRSRCLLFRRIELDFAGDAAWSQIRHHEKPFPANRFRMTRFSDLGERHPCNGIFLCGMAPVFFIVGSKGLFVHRLLVDGSVSSMTPFSNVNCPQGFILAITTDQLKICTLHKERMDAPWPCNKVPLRCTPHRLAFYSEARIYMTIISRQIPVKEHLPEEEGGDAHATITYAVNSQASKERGTEEGHEVQTHSISI